jgi:hypothetical protein
MADNVGELLKDPTTPGTVLIVLLVDALGTEWFDWEPETLDREVFGAWKTSMSPHNRDKVWAVATLLTTNQFYRNLDCFIHTCNALNDHGSDFHNFDPASVSDMAWALAETSLLDPAEKSDQSRTFAAEIIRYMTAMMDEEGFSRAPKILAKFASPSGDESKLQVVLEGDGIDYRTYWTDQERKRVDIDQHVATKLALTLELIARLPLKNADQEALKELQQRASKALGAQQKELQQETESASPRIQL